MKCNNCGNKKFFVDTLGIEHCSNPKCFAPTGYLTEATGHLSFRQIELEEELEKIRKKRKEKS